MQVVKSHPVCKGVMRSYGIPYGASSGPGCSHLRYSDQVGMEPKAIAILDQACVRLVQEDNARQSLVDIPVDDSKVNNLTLQAGFGSAV